MTITALHNQSLFDLAIQVFGSVAYAFELALANGLSITSDLEPGQLITLPNSSPLGRSGGASIANYYAANGIKPATALRPEDVATGDNDSCNYCKLFE